MHYFSLELLGYLFIFLFIVYIIAKDDYIFLRKNISLEQLFNIAILGSLIGLIFARLVFVVLHFKPDYFNPLVLLLFPYFPGLCLPGGIAAGALFLVSYCRSKKLPLGHIGDIFLLAFFSVLPIGYAFTFFVMQRQITMAKIFISVFSFILLGALVVGYKLKLREGTTGLLCLFSFSTIFLLYDMLSRKGGVRAFGPEDFLTIAIFIVSLVLLLKQERLISFGTRIIRK